MDVESINSKKKGFFKECRGNFVLGFPCKNVNLLSLTNLLQLNFEINGANDVWGWHDETNNKEYGIIGLYQGTAFIDITDGKNPTFIGILPSHTTGSNWHDIKVCQNHAYIVSEASGHGMQIFDLTQLDSITNTPDFNLKETAHMDTFGQAHNIFINEDTLTAYIVGSWTSGAFGGLYMVNITDPVNPEESGKYSEDGYTHDVQCVIYEGPDDRYTGEEICFACNEDSVTIINTSDKANATMISKFTYDAGYTHQGWLTDDMNYFLMDDEMDEFRSCTQKTNTRILDVQDLENPVLHAQHLGPTNDIDHNLYVHNGYVYQANYNAGLRILDLSSIDDGTLTEVGYFDVSPFRAKNDFGGAWSVYPFLPSGKILVSAIEKGLFVLEPTGLAKNANSFLHVRNLFAEHNDNKDSDSKVMRVFITLHDHSGRVADEAKVIGTFNNVHENIKTCVTDKLGVCSIEHPHGDTNELLTFRVLGVEKVGYHYKSSENSQNEHSDGKSITINKRGVIVRKNKESKLSKLVNNVMGLAGVIHLSMT
eukprot:CAMPEP_0178948120 /NCGR_PEP_ID=MMETSP0789-20121207/5294_1 /TAXON_ID=3005 /ORGANISM="Rhizosolenia setigera, Strain CCMP 1694" /LENGTH=536 /DNA_ID=CAMNT_0020628447 /DNA_START=359 /DNA_END=1965 /DNA_ORIENTATION=+